MKPPSHPQEYAMWKQERVSRLRALHDQIERASKWYKRGLFSWAEKQGKRGWWTDYDQRIQVLKEYLTYLKS